jgi:benzoyl-CoA reductase/2-hydroxyglutaryl-CoA dehydratase subunit BcrC/BadD/HgdB
MVRKPGNPHAEDLGCEVNLCQARRCDPQRMEFCALRKAWQERCAVLLLQMRGARSAGSREIYMKRLQALGWKHD